MRLHVILILVVCAIGMLSSLMIAPATAQTGDAEVTRTRNLQHFELEPNNIDVTRLRNLQYFELEINNIDVTRLRNLQYFELEPNNIDVTRLRNLQYFELEPNNIDVTRLRNLQYFELVELANLTINIKNLVTTDQDGNLKNASFPNEIIQFDFTIENIGSRNLPKGLVSVMALDPTNTPVFLAYTFVNLPSGLSNQIIFGYRIPIEAPIGDYTARVMVFTDWPSKGGIGLDIETITFTVP